MQPRHGQNLKVVAPCVVVIGIMLGLVAYSPTLYRMFCGATGLGGTTQRAYSDPNAISQQTIRVAFDSNVAPGLPWRFEPEQRAVTVHLGEQKLVYFSAENLGDEPIVGHATFNVTPQTTGIYFNKIQCFCFDEERLDAHQKVDMPVVFFVDPAFGKDPEMRGVELDHARLYVFPFGKSPKGQRSVAVSGGRGTRCCAWPAAFRRAMHRVSRARQQQDRSDAGRRGRAQGRFRSRLRVFSGVEERRPRLVHRQSRSLAG